MWCDFSKMRKRAEQNERFSQQNYHIYDHCTGCGAEKQCSIFDFWFKIFDENSEKTGNVFAAKASRGQDALKIF